MKKGPLYVLACYILWGLFPIFWKQLSGVDSIYVLASRVVWAFAFCAVILLARGKFAEFKAVFKDRADMIRLFITGVMVTFNWGFYIIAVHNNHILDGSLAYYMNPILTVIISFIIYKEKLTSRQMLAVCIAAAGVAYQVIMYGAFPTYAVIIGGSFAIYGAVKKQVKASSEISLAIETMFIVPFALAYMIYAKRAGIDGVSSLGNYWFMLPLAGGVTSIPLIFFAMGIKDTPLSMSGILMFTNPTLQLLVGTIIYGEAFTKTNAIAFVVIWIALLIYIPTIIKRGAKV